MLSSVCATADQYSIASLQTPPQFLRYSLAPLTCEKDLWDTWTPALGAVCPRDPATVQLFNLVSGFTPSDGGIYHQQVDFTQLLSAQCEDVLFPSGLLQVHECHFDHEEKWTLHIFFWSELIHSSLTTVKPQLFFSFIACLGQWSCYSLFQLVPACDPASTTHRNLPKS